MSVKISKLDSLCKSFCYKSLVCINLLNNKDIKMSSFKSSRNIQKKADGLDRSILRNEFSSVALNEMTMKANKSVL